MLLLLARACPPAGRRSLLRHLPSARDGRLVLCSLAPLDAAAPFEGFEELPPGIYSLQLGAPPSAAAAAAAAAPAPAASEQTAAGQQAAGRLPAVLARHDWTDEPVRRLASFWRDERLTAPEPTQDAAAAGGAAASGAAAGGAAAAEPVVPAAADEGPAFQATVDSVLSALRQAVATRCRCIEERRPRGRTDGGAAATAAAGACHAGTRLAGLQLNGGTAGAAGAAGGGGARPCSQEDAEPAPLLILFSGGVDSTLLAALAHEALPPSAPIDLASICFAGGASPDRQSALDALAELQAFAPGRRWRFIQARPPSVEGQGGRAAPGGLSAAGVSCRRNRRLIAPRPSPVCLLRCHRWTVPWRTLLRRRAACCACWPLRTR